MIVSAAIPIDSTIDRRRAVFSQLQALTSAYFRQRRSERHRRIQAFLAEPESLDAVLPGVAEQAPGAGNDSLRHLRYGDDDRYGLSKLGTDPEQLRAALVAQRIRCWRAQRPSEAFAASVCRESQGAARCRFLHRDGRGWLCAKLTPLSQYLNDQADAGELAALGDNCSGRGAR